MSIFAPAPPPARIYLEDEGVQLPVRSRYDFQGSGVTVTDDAANGQTVVTIPGGSVDWAGAGIYRPQDYGTIDPTGAADSYTAFQAALNAMNAADSGGVVQVPPGRYRIDTGLTLPDKGYGAHSYEVGRAIRGPVWGSATLVAGPSLSSPILTATGNLAAGIPAVEITDIGFNANNVALPAVLRLDRTAWAYVQRVMMLATGATIGVDVRDVVHGVYENVTVQNGATCWKFTQPNGMTCNNTVMRSCWAAGATSWGVDIQSGSPFLIEGCDLEAGTGSGIRYNYAGGHVVMRGPLYYEGLSSGAMFDITAGHARIEGPIHGIMGGIQNRGTTVLTVQDWIDATTCVNASGATLNKVHCPGLTGSGGTTNVWHS